MDFVKDKVGFTVVFWRKNVEIEYIRKFDFNSLTPQEKKIVLYLEEHGSLTRKDVEELLAIKSSRARYLLNNLTEKKIIYSIGKTNNLEYHLK